MSDPRRFTSLLRVGDVIAQDGKLYRVETVDEYTAGGSDTVIGQTVEIVLVDDDGSG